jgi:hypothetical protein
LLFSRRDFVITAPPTERESRFLVIKAGRRPDASGC